MKNRGEISTLVIVGIMTVIGVATLVSATLNNQPQTTSTRAGAGLCRDNPIAPPDGYTWKALCDMPCTDNSVCPVGANFQQGWCYGFEGASGTSDDWRCLELVSGSSGGTNPPPPTGTSNDNVCLDLADNRSGGKPEGVVAGTDKNSQTLTCDPACCEWNDQCQSGQSCNTGNGWCKSGFSCGASSVAPPVEDPPLEPSPVESNVPACESGKLNQNNVCDPACCSANSQCTNGETCTRGNGFCQSGLSCEKKTEPSPSDGSGNPVGPSGTTTGPNPVLTPNNGGSPSNVCLNLSTCQSECYPNGCVSNNNGCFTCTSQSSGSSGNTSGNQSPPEDAGNTNINPTVTKYFSVKLNSSITNGLHCKTASVYLITAYLYKDEKKIDTKVFNGTNSNNNVGNINFLSKGFTTNEKMRVEAHIISHITDTNGKVSYPVAHINKPYYPSSSSYSSTKANNISINVTFDCGDKDYLVK